MTRSAVYRLLVLVAAGVPLILGSFLSAVANRLSFMVWAGAAAAILVVVLRLMWGSPRARSWMGGVAALLVLGSLGVLLQVEARPLELGVAAVVPQLIVGEARVASRPGATGTASAVPVALPFYLHGPFWWGSGALLAITCFGLALRERRADRSPSRDSDPDSDPVPGE